MANNKYRLLAELEALYARPPGYVLIAEEFPDGSIEVATTEIARFGSNDDAHDERKRLAALDARNEYLVVAEQAADGRGRLSPTENEYDE